MTLLGGDEDHDTTGTYQLQNVELGPLSFTLLSLDSPTVPTTWDTFGAGASAWIIIRFLEPAFYACCSGTGAPPWPLRRPTRRALSCPSLAPRVGALSFSSQSSGIVINAEFIAAADAPLTRSQITTKLERAAADYAAFV